MDPLSLVMFALIAVLIFFMFRNGKKRQQAQQEMQNNLRPGAEVMLQSGIYGTVESVDDENTRVTIRSGDSTLVVHRNAVGQITAPVEAAAESSALAPDDDPEFGERLSEAAHEVESKDESSVQNDLGGESDIDSDENGKPKA